MVCVESNPPSWPANLQRQISSPREELEELRAGLAVFRQGGNPLGSKVAALEDGLAKSSRKHGSSKVELELANEQLGRAKEMVRRVNKSNMLLEAKDTISSDIRVLP